MDIKTLIFKHKFLVITLVVILIAGLFYFTDLKYLFLNYSFDYEDCKEIDRLTMGFEKLTNIQWVDDDLVIKGISNFNCGGSIKGNYKLEENIINLHIKNGLFSFISTMCNCDREIVFRIKNLPKKEYEIKYYDNTNNQNRLRDWLRLGYPINVVKVDCNQYPEESVKECLLKQALNIPKDSECANSPVDYRFYCYATESCQSLPEGGEWNIKDVCYNRFGILCETLPDDEMKVCRSHFRNI